MNCKLCGGAASWAFRVPQDRIVGRTGSEAGPQVDYYRCGSCGFVFTPYLDQHSPGKLNAEIYNELYWTEIDPLDRSWVPLMFVKRFMFGRRLRFLDYGCGQGSGVALLREHGYEAFGYDIGSHFRCRDYCSSTWTSLPAQFDVILCYEVIEHLTQPLQLFDRLEELLVPDGLFFFTTYLITEEQGADFWYVAPRNGHVSIFSARSLDYLGRRYDYAHLTMFRPHLHLYVKGAHRHSRGSWLKVRYAAGTLLGRLASRTNPPQAVTRMRPESSVEEGQRDTG